MKEAERIIHPNGATSKFNNKRISIVEQKDKQGFSVFFKRLAREDEDLSIPTCSNQVINNKIRLTGIGLSSEAIEELIILYSAYKDKDIETWTHE